MKTDEFGMYWAKNTSGYYWNERPIAVQAAIIEAFAEVEKNKTEVDEMKIWLLKQKQTQRWDSPMATVNAIYALLHQGSDWLANEGSVQIKVGNILLQPSSTEAGTGYFKETIPVASVRPEMGKVTISNIEGVTQSHPLTYLPKTSAILSFTSDIEYFRGCNLSFRRYIGCFGAYNLSKRYDAGCFTGYNLCFRDYIGCFSGYDLLKDRMGDV